MPEPLERLKAVLADRYRVERELGAGGMATVYLAQDLKHGRQVAIKVFRPELAATLGPERFLREVRIAATLQHPHILALYDSGQADGFLYYVMPYVDGPSLRQKLLREGELPITEAVWILRDLADALAYAHRQGVVHRDIKPENVMLSGRHALVADFGVAKAVSEATGRQPLTTSGLAVGTPAYMAPEQAAADEHTDHRADLYAFGVVAYELLTGGPPFTGTTPQVVLGAHATRTPEPVAARRPGIPPTLAALVMRCLEKMPADRWQSAEELVHQLETVLTPSGGATPESPRPAGVVTAPPVAPRRRAIRLTRGARWALGLTAVLLAVVLAAVYRGSVGRPGAADRAHSVAVLPFVDMSPDRGQEYFSDGLTEELISDLSGIPGLRVVGRTSSFQFKGKNEDLRLIGRRLHVANVLEGSVRRDGNRVRVTAQLINAEDGFHLWSESYDRELNDIFAVQDDIARAVAGALRVTILRTRESSPETRSTEAYEARLKGSDLFSRSGRENLEKAAEYFELATRLDPGYAKAWAYLGATRAWQAGVGYLPSVEGFEQGRAAVERALTLDPNLAQAWSTRGWIQMSYDWDFAAADSSYGKARALHPGSGVLEAAQLALALGRAEQAVALARQATEGDPLLAQAHFTRGLVTYYAGRLEEAVSEFGEVLELYPTFVNVHGLLAQIHLARSDAGKALEEAELEKDPFWRLPALAMVMHAQGRARESDGNLAEFSAKYASVGAYQVAEVHGFRGEAERACQWLERAYAGRDGGLFLMAADPLFARIRQAPCYLGLLKRMRLGAATGLLRRSAARDDQERADGSQ